MHRQVGIDVIPAIAGNVGRVIGSARQSFEGWRRASLSTAAFLGAILLCGLVFGGCVAGQLNTATSSILGQAMQHFINAVQSHQLASPKSVWSSQALAGAELFGLIWLSGISLLGLPLVTIALFLRAFSVGFAVAYSTLEFGWHGFFIASLVVFAHQLLALSGLWCAGILAVRLSTSVFRRTFAMEELPSVLLRYTAGLTLCLAITWIGAVIQAFVAPPLLVALLPH